MKRKELIAEALSTKSGTEEYVLSTHDIGFQKTWKQIVGLPSKGQQNPNWSDAHTLIMAVREHGLDNLPRPEMSFESARSRGNPLPEESTNEKSWAKADNWCNVRKKLGGYGLSPANDGVMTHLLELGLITATNKPNYDRIVKEAVKMRVGAAVKKYKEGETRMVTVNQRSRHGWRKELLPTWDGIDEATQEDLFAKFGSHQVAEDHVDYCHKVPICQGERETTKNDVFLTSHHRTYDRIAKEMDYPGHEAVVAVLEDSLFKV